MNHLRKFILLLFVGLTTQSPFCYSDSLTDSVLLIPHKDFNHRFFKVALYTESSCLADLSSIMKTDSTIAEGVKALGKIMGTKAEMQLNCLTGFLAQWDQLLPPMPELKDDDYEETSAIFHKKFKYDTKKQDELEKKYNCFNPYPKGSSDFKYHVTEYGETCKNKWITAEAAAPIKKKIEEEQAKYLAAKKDFQFTKDLGKTIFQMLRKTLLSEDDSEKIQAIDKQLECYNPYESGTSDFQYKEKYAPAECKDHWLTKDVADTLEKEKAVEVAKIAELNKIPAQYNEQLSTIKTEPLLLQAFDQNELKELVKTYKCFLSSDDPITIKNHKKQNDWLCHGMISTEVEKSQSIKKMRALFGDIPKTISEFRLKKEALILSAQKNFDEKNAVAFRRYALRRLLTRYTSFLKKGGKPSEAKEFCKNLAASDKRDKEYERAGLPITYFSEESHWSVAQKYGLSEVEYAAILEYTNSFYQTINPALWKKELSDKLKIYKEVTDRGLQKIPPYNASPLIRFTNLPPTFAAQYQVDKIVCHDAYTSTSKKQDWAWSEDSYKFTIYPGPKAHAVYEISTHDSEEEVLLESGICFKVLSKSGSPPHEEFEMVEVDSTGNPVGKQFPKP